MAGVSETPGNARPPAVSAVLCVEGEALDRFGRVLRPFSVGLVDQAISVRWLSSDPRVNSLALGPIQCLVHPRIGWPGVGRRIERLLEALAAQPPTLVQAMSQASYRLASAIAEAFDADLVLAVTSTADCERIAQLRVGKHARYHAFSEPLAAVLETQLKIGRESIEVIRPGVQVSQRAACFAEPGRVATVLCTSSFERAGGVDRLITAVGMLGQRGHALQVFLLGEGRQEAALRGLVRSRNLSSSVTFAPPLGDLTAAMQNADIFVRPSADTEFTADALLAMGAGMVVVTDPSSLCDHVRSGETAMVCSHPTAESLSEAIDGILNHREEAAALAAAAMEYVRGHHSMSAMADRTAAAYRKLALTRTTFAIRES